ncbi:hypothetical protein TZ00_14355 [Agreia bicolorata]|uniref:Uncharacterized protein n=2 Tax=Agreia bicolorata TaxID=110935 RepID=A0ABR5CDG5_9MICO|nr:hypothetical protein TZ00_14355 [Agreia bicolorata]
MDEIPARVIRLFGNDKARPKVMRVYNANTGWAAAEGTPIITWQTVEDLLRQGSTSAEVKWRFRTRQFSILDMKRPALDGSVEQTQPGAGQARRGRGIQN